MDPYRNLPASAFNSQYFTTNSGAPVWNNNSSLTVGTREYFIRQIIQSLVASLDSTTTTKPYSQHNLGSANMNPHM